MIEKFCSDCWEIVAVEFDEVVGSEICAECEWVNLFHTESEAVDALKADAEMDRAEMFRDEMMFSMMD